MTAAKVCLYLINKGRVKPECPLSVSVNDNRLTLDVSLNRLQCGAVNITDAQSFAEEFLNKLQTKDNFTITCSADCPNSCFLCVESILKLVKTHAS